MENKNRLRIILYGKDALKDVQILSDNLNEKKKFKKIYN